MGRDGDAEYDYRLVQGKRKEIEQKKALAPSLAIEPTNQ
jgi:hypothetical protein